MKNEYKAPYSRISHHPILMVTSAISVIKQPTSQIKSDQQHQGKNIWKNQNLYKIYLKSKWCTSQIIQSRLREYNYWNIDT